MTWRKDTPRGYDDPGPGNTSPAQQITGYSNTTGPASADLFAGRRPAYADTEPREVRTLRRARVRAS